MLERGPDRPPHEARILHHARLHQRRDIGVVLGLGTEQFRHAGARQLVIRGEAITLQPGRARAPERRGGRERDEQRQVGEHAHHDVDPVVRIRQLDMHVQAAQHVALADHLQIFHHVVVALRRRLARRRPGRGRMRADREDREPMLGRDVRDGLAQEFQLGAGVGDVVVRRCRDLELRLQHLAHRLSAGDRLHPLEKRLRHLARDRLGLGVDQKILFLDTELEIVGHGPPLPCQCRDLRRELRAPSTRISKTAGKSGRSEAESGQHWANPRTACGDRKRRRGDFGSGA